MVTVLSPSNAMIQNLKSPTQTLATSAPISEASGEPTQNAVGSTGPSHPTTADVTVSSADQGDGASPSEDETDQSAQAVSDSASAQVLGEESATDSPVLKARLQQSASVATSTAVTVSSPRVVNGAGGEQTDTAARNTATPQKSVPSASGDAQNGDDELGVPGNDGVAQGTGGPDNLIEKEQAALSLLTFANQVPME